MLCSNLQGSLLTTFNSSNAANLNTLIAGLQQPGGLATAPQLLQVGVAAMLVM